MLDVINVARYIINYSNQKEYGISNLRLQKLLYFVQAYYLAFTEVGNPCFNDEIEAWDFGPVVPRVYQEFKRFGSGNIPTITSYIVFDDEDIWSAHSVEFDNETIPKCDRERINKVVDKFSSYSTTSLVSLTHNQRPWRDAYSGINNGIISKESIKEYFSC